MCYESYESYESYEEWSKTPVLRCNIKKIKVQENSEKLM